MGLLRSRSVVAEDVRVRLTDLHRGILSMHANPPPGCIDICDFLIVESLLIRPGVDSRKLQRAYRKLLLRHDILRLRFDGEPDTWTSRICGVGERGLRIIDFGDIDDATFDKEVRELALSPICPLAAELAELLLIRCGSRGDVVCFRMNHIISDGTGMITMLNDLIKFMMGLPVGGPPPTHQEFLEHIELPRVQWLERKKYWQDALLPAPAALPIGRSANGETPSPGCWYGHRCCVTPDLRPEQRAGLERRAKNASPLLSAYLGAVLVRAMASLTGQDRMYVRFLAGPSDPRIASYSGFNTYAFPLLYDRSITNDLVSLAIDAGKRLANAVSNVPFEFTNNYVPMLKEIAAAGGNPNQLGVYTGTPRRHLANTLLAPFADVPAGEKIQVGPYGIELLNYKHPMNYGTDITLEYCGVEELFDITLITDKNSFSEAETADIADAVRVELDLE